MLRSIGEQSGESVGSVLKQERKATVGRTCRKKGFQPGMKERGGDGTLIILIIIIIAGHVHCH